MSRSSPGRIRTTSAVVANDPSCLPLKEAYEWAVATSPKSWRDVEERFLRAMEAFDDNVSSGFATKAARQNGKGDFFNDLLALLLENCAQVSLHSRPGVAGLTFPRHKLDVAYPSTGTVEFVLEAKAVGTPKHPGSPSEGAIGRAGSADLDKRVKEIGFKAIDLKAEYAREAAERGQSPSAISGDLTSWLRSVKPRSYVFVAARVIGDRDRERLFQYSRVANLVSDAVGVFCFRPTSDSTPTRYRAEKVPSDIELSRVLFRACQELTSLRATRTLAAPSASPSPAEIADRIPPE